MSTCIRPFQEDIANNRPGIALFVWRVSVLCIFFVFSIFLFAHRIDSMSVIRKVMSLSYSLVLLLMIFYYVYLILLFKKLCYDVTENSLTIRSFLLNKKIEFSEIKELTRLDNETLALKKKKFFSYFRETPQIVYPVAQLGRGTLERFGAVTFYSFVGSFKEPGNLVLISTRDNRRYAISAVPIDEFVSLVNRGKRP